MCKSPGEANIGLSWTHPVQKHLQIAAHRVNSGPIGQSFLYYRSLCHRSFDFHFDLTPQFHINCENKTKQAPATATSHFFYCSFTNLLNTLLDRAHAEMYEPTVNHAHACIRQFAGLTPAERPVLVSCLSARDGKRNWITGKF